MSLHPIQTPPPSDALRALVAQGKPVSLRRPWLQLVIYLGCATVLATVGVLGVHVRRDVSALAMAPMMMSSALWALAVLVAAFVAIIPPRGQVLPSFATSRAGALLALGLALATLLLIEDSPITRHPSSAQTLTLAMHCERLGVLLLAPLLIVGWALALRRLPVGRMAGAALGAASGALAGFVLHLICGIGGVSHALFGHVGVLVVGALAGALLSRR